jgi:immune inhibitor A
MDAKEKSMTEKSCPQKDTGMHVCRLLSRTALAILSFFCSMLFAACSNRSMTLSETQTLSPTDTPIPSPTPTPPRIEPDEMAEILANMEIPDYDPIDYEARYSMEEPNIRTILSPPRNYKIGSIEGYHYYIDTEYRSFDTELRYETEHIYMWVELGVEVKQTALAQAAETFENEIYPTVRDYFGEEWSPGVDNDPHIWIVHLRDRDATPAWFSFIDEYNWGVSLSSNQHEMIYINLAYNTVGSDNYFGALAHEFQHMVQWNNPGNETRALDEGLAQLAETICGYPDDYRYLSWNPKTQLNTWTNNYEVSSDYYAVNYLFSLYLWERLGDNFIRALARHPGEGFNSIDATLRELLYPFTVDDFFTDWIVANYLDDPSLADGRYGYQNQTLGTIVPELRYDTLPVHETISLPQYSAEYIEYQGQGDISIDFQGSTEVNLLPTQAHSGHSFWWSNRSHDAEINLTRSVPMAGLKVATLRFWMWYDISPGDELCIRTSYDGGNKWHTESAGIATPEDSFFACYTGISGEGEQPEWVMEEIDIGHLEGKDALLRFDYVIQSDENRPGFAIDDITIPELNYAYDAESGDDSWEGVGFVRTSNVVPQNWVIHLLTLGNRLGIQHLEVAPDGTAHAKVVLGDGVEKIVLIVGAMATSTTEPAQFEFSLTEESEASE